MTPIAELKVVTHYAEQNPGLTNADLEKLHDLRPATSKTSRKYKPSLNGRECRKNPNTEAWILFPMGRECGQVRSPVGNNGEPPHEGITEADTVGWLLKWAVYLIVS